MAETKQTVKEKKTIAYILDLLITISLTISFIGLAEIISGSGSNNCFNIALCVSGAVLALIFIFYAFHGKYWKV